MTKLQTIIATWQQRAAGLKCNEICTELRHLGFSVRDGKRGNHKIVSHPSLPEFIGTNFDCGHGINPIVKPVYIRKLLRILREHQDELERLLE